MGAFGEIVPSWRVGWLVGEGLIDSALPFNLAFSPGEKELEERSSERFAK